MRAGKIALVIMLIAGPQLYGADSRESMVPEKGGTDQQILVVGAVHKNGFFPIQQDAAMRLKAAIEMAGDLTSEAEESGIRILRPEPNESGKGEDYIILHPESFSDGEDNNPELQSADIVYVPTKLQAITVSGGAKASDTTENLSTEEVISSLETQNKRVLHEIEMQKEKVATLNKESEPALWEAESNQLKRFGDLHDLLNKRLDTIRNSMKTKSPSRDK
jgi:hypothetical protein